MAANDRKSVPLTNADSSPIVPSYPFETNGMVRSSTGHIAKVAGDTNDSVFRLVRLPSNARLIGRTLKNDALTGATDCDIGLYETNDGAVVEKDLLEDGISLASAGSAFAPFAQIAPEDAAKRLWELAGETEDPGGEYDVALTGNTFGTAAGDIRLEVLWTL